MCLFIFSSRELEKNRAMRVVRMIEYWYSHDEQSLALAGCPAAILVVHKVGGGSLSRLGRSHRFRQGSMRQFYTDTRTDVN